MPADLKGIGYDQYRSIRYRRDKALWRGEGLPFQVEFFHRGFIFEDRVQIYVVEDGKAQLFAYSPDLFTFGMVKPPPANSHVGFAGFRLHAPINRPDYYDEVGVFLGASYFRAVAKGQVYGLSARGLAIAHRRPQGRGIPLLQDLLDREAGQGHQLDRGACPARQPECGGGLPLHHPARRDHHLRRAKWRSTRAPRSGRRGSPRSPACSSSTPTTGSASTTTGRRCTIPAGWPCATAAARSCGAR